MIRLLAITIASAVASVLLEQSYPETFMCVGLGVLLLDS